MNDVSIILSEEDSCGPMDKDEEQMYLTDIDDLFLVKNNIEILYITIMFLN